MCAAGATMQVLSNLSFTDDPRPVGRYALSLNTSDLSTVVRAARAAATRGGVLIIDDEGTLDRDDGTQRIRAAVAAANRATRVFVYGRPRQMQYPVDNDAKASADKLASGRWDELLAQPENDALAAWRDANDADRRAGLYDGVAGALVEFRQYEDFDVAAQVAVTVNEARRASGLPVAALLQPQYARGGGIRAELAGQWIPRDRMRALLWALRTAAVEYLLIWHGEPEPRTQAWDDFLADVAAVAGPFAGATR